MQIERSWYKVITLNTSRYNVITLTIHQQPAFCCWRLAGCVWDCVVVDSLRVRAINASIFWFSSINLICINGWRFSASAVCWPYKDGNIAREEGARLSLLWHSGERKQRGGANRFTMECQMACAIMMVKVKAILWQ